MTTLSGSRRLGDIHISDVETGWPGSDHVEWIETPPKKIEKSTTPLTEQ
nr:hypothetical protein [Hoeflea marina]